jgi:hypothetical protein
MVLLYRTTGDIEDGGSAIKENHMDDRIHYQNVYGLLTDGGPILRCEYRGVLMHVVEGDDWISIWAMVSTDPGKGHCQAMIARLREDFPDHKLCGSIPMNATSKHIFDKCGVDYPHEEFYDRIDWADADTSFREEVKSWQASG